MGVSGRDRRDMAWNQVQARSWCPPEWLLPGDHPGCGWASGPGEQGGPLFREQCPEGQTWVPHLSLAHICARSEGCPPPPALVHVYAWPPWPQEPCGREDSGGRAQALHRDRCLLYSPPLVSPPALGVSRALGSRLSGPAARLPAGHPVWAELIQMQVTAQAAAGAAGGPPVTAWLDLRRRARPRC